LNRNLTAVAFTIVALGIIATFDIIPGAGLYAGITMLAIGAVALLDQLVTRNRAFRSPARSTPVAAASLPVRS
jgi:hypothetical protein